MFAVTFAILVAVASADISHLLNNSIPTNYNDASHHHYHPDGIQTQHFETKIEKHEVVELPTQIEIIEEGQPIYGVHPLFSTKNSYDSVPKVKSNYLSAENSNLQPPQVPYEESMKIYLPPVATGPTANDIPEATTISPVTPSSELFSAPKSEINSYSMATNDIPTEEKVSYDKHTQLPETPQNSYPSPLGIMLPPSESMPQITYQQYQEQLMREENMKRSEMHFLKDTNEVLDHQPVLPLEYDHSFLSKDGWLQL